MAKEFFVVNENGKLKMVLKTVKKMCGSLKKRPTGLLMIIRDNKIKSKTIKVLNQEPTT